MIWLWTAAIFLLMGGFLLFRSIQAPIFLRPYRIFFTLIRQRRFEIVATREERLYLNGGPATHLKIWNARDPENTKYGFSYTIQSDGHHVHHIISAVYAGPFNKVTFSIIPLTLPHFLAVSSAFNPGRQAIELPSQELFNQYYSLHAIDPEATTNLVYPELINYFTSLADQGGHWGLEVSTYRVSISQDLGETLLDNSTLNTLRQILDEVLENVQMAGQEETHTADQIIPL